MVFALVAEVLASSYFSTPDGRITITPEGGTPPYTYLWDTGDLTPEIIVPAGVYTVIVTDATLATVTETYTVTQPLTFDLRIEPYSVDLLSDNLSRDVICRRTVSSGSQIIGRGQATMSLYTRATSASYDAIGTIVGAKEPDGSGGIMISVYDEQTPYDIVHITKDGVTIQGSLNILGETTEVVVNDIKVIDRTISLSSGVTDSAEVDGSGVLMGSGGALRSILYRSASDAMVFDTSILTDGQLRLGSSWNGATARLSADSFEVANGTPAISLTGAGLVLTNAKLVNPIPTTAHVQSDAGLTHLASGQYFGWDAANGVWGATGGGVRASGFTAGDATWNSSGLNFPNPQGSDAVTLDAQGLSAGSAAAVTREGLDLLSDDACISFGNRAWRLVYDAVENALVFQKRETDDSYTTKLTLD